MVLVDPAAGVNLRVESSVATTRAEPIAQHLVVCFLRSLFMPLLLFLPRLHAMLFFLTRSLTCGSSFPLLRAFTCASGGNEHEDWPAPARTAGTPAPSWRNTRRGTPSSCVTTHEGVPVEG